MAIDNRFEIVDREYGKSAVKLLHIRRDGPKHHIREYEVETKLMLTTDKDYVKGDNSDVVATDSQKNTVYLVAKNEGVQSPEKFGLALCRHFLRQYPFVCKAKVTVKCESWKRIQVGESSGEQMPHRTKVGTPHNHAFVHKPTFERGARVILRRGQDPEVTVTLGGLRVLKTTQSAFVNFVSDEYRSLPDMKDRVFSTVVQATWKYNKAIFAKGFCFCAAYDKVYQAIMTLFAGPADTGIYSPSVQQTLYLTQKLILETMPEVDSVHMAMPNRHYFSIDLSKFPGVGYSENNDVLLPVDKPAGLIEATLARKDLRARL